MTYDQYEKLQEQMVKECNSIVMNCQKLSWYMRGGVSFTDIMNMSTKELDNLNKIVESNLETTKKSKMPFF